MRLPRILLAAMRVLAAVQVILGVGFWTGHWYGLLPVHIVSGGIENGLVIDVGPSRLKHTVEATRGWDDYCSATIGELTLTAGPHRLEMHADG